MPIRSTTWAVPGRLSPDRPAEPAPDENRAPPPDTPASGHLTPDYGLVLLLVVVLDVSHSVFTEQEKVHGLCREMLDEIRSDTLANVTVRVAFVVFSDRPQVTPFVPVEEANAPALTFGGATAFWAAMRATCELVMAEVERAGAQGKSVQKILVPVVSDFLATDQPGDVPALVHRTEARVRMNVLPIAAGSQPNMGVANALSRRRGAVRMDDAKVKEMFEFISCSVVMASRSQPGERLELPVDALAKFARVD